VKKYVKKTKKKTVPVDYCNHPILCG